MPGRLAVSTSSFLIFNLILLAVVLEADLGRRKVSALRVLRPLIGAAVIVPFFLSSPAQSGWGLGLELAGVAVGVGLGLGAAALLPVSWSLLDRRSYSRGGIGYALIWVATSAARYLFAYGAQHWFGVPLRDFMITNRVSPDTLADALIFLFLTMYLIRTASLAIRPLILARCSKAASSGGGDRTAAGGAVPQRLLSRPAEQVQRVRALFGRRHVSLALGPGDHAAISARFASLTLTLHDLSADPNPVTVTADCFAARIELVVPATARLLDSGSVRFGRRAGTQRPDQACGPLIHLGGETEFGLLRIRYSQNF